MADDQAIKVSYCVNGHPGVSHTENECPVCHALAETRGLTSRLNAREEEVKAHMELLAAAMERAEKAEKERAEAVAWGQRVEAAIVKHYPVGWAYDGASPELMVNNVYQHGEEEIAVELKRAYAERDSLRRALEEIQSRIKVSMSPILIVPTISILAARALAGEEGR